MEIHKLLDARKHELHKLGPRRGTSSEQRSYLLDISVQFQDIVKSDLNNNHADFFDEDPNLRFVNRLVKRNENFQESMNLFGQLYQLGDSRPRPVEQDERVQAQEVVQPEPRTHEVRETKQEADLSEVTIPQTIVKTLPGGDTVEWLRAVYNNSRGFEVGTFNPTILGKAMQKFSTTWERLALGYIDVITFAHAFIMKSLQRICPDKRVRSGLLSAMMEELLARYRTASDQVRFLLSVERDERPYTLNPTLTERLRESRRERLQSEMAESSIRGCQHGTVVKIEEIGKTKDISNVDHTIQEVYNIVQAYYDVAKTRFTDNVCLQAAKHSFVSGPRTPFQLLSPKFVDHLTSEQLEDIAGEDAYYSTRRKELVRDISKLEAGKKLLQ